MAEFALIAPMGFLLLLSIVVIGIVTTNFIQVTNATRDGARVAAICAGEGSGGTIPDGTARACTVQNLQSYVQAHLTSIPANVLPSFDICTSSGSCGAPLSSGTDLTGVGCNSSELLEVQMSYDQPLYLPMVSAFFATKPNGTRTLQATAEAGCE